MGEVEMILHVYTQKPKASHPVLILCLFCRYVEVVVVNNFGEDHQVTLSDTDGPSFDIAVSTFVDNNVPLLKSLSFPLSL
jgi:hypothetical protein